mgnify:CR=1 FL=1
MSSKNIITAVSRCEHCGAKLDEPCRGPSGRTVPMHAKRRLVQSSLKLAFRTGYAKALHNAATIGAKHDPALCLVCQGAES